MACRGAECGDQLEAECDALAPHRSKASDGDCPSAAHQNANPHSDHNADPNMGGRSCAKDITHSPETGLDAHGVVAPQIVHDPRLKYAIRHNWEGGYDEIYYPQEGHWRRADVIGDHKNHLHVSFVHDLALLTSTAHWLGAPAPPKPPPPLPEKVKPDMHVTIDSPIVSFYSARQGAWLLLENGGVITLKGGFYGAPFGKPYFARRTGARLIANPKLFRRLRHPYVVVAQTGELYGTDGF